MQSSPHRRVLLRGGSIYSPSSPNASAMLVVDGVIAWVGEEDAAAGQAEDVDRVVELDGRLVTPGFVDAHVHLAATGFALQSVDLAGASDRRAALERLAAYVKTYRGPVVFAHGWDESAWPDRRHPTRGEIDRVVGDIPAYVARVDSHSAVISSALLALRPDLITLDGWSDDGRVERDAHHGVRDITHGLWSSDDRRHAIRLALRHAAARGVTSVHELNAPHIAPFDDFHVIHELARAEPLPEVVPYWGQLFDGDDPSEVVVGYAGDLCVDGAIGSRTAALAAPYNDAETAGHLYLERAQICEHVIATTRSGKQAGFHVIGDRAMREVTAGFRAAAAQLGIDAMVAARHRLEHAEMPDDADIATMAELGIVASVQPAFDAAWGASGELYETRLGADRAEPMNPFGRMHAAGVALAFGSDSPVTPIDPWAAIRAALNHHRESERITARAAFNAHTRGGHRARRADGLGVLGPGAPATYAVWELSSGLRVQTPDERVAAWSTDIRAGVPLLPDLDPELPLPRCMLTVADGITIFDHEESA
jgi:predicted amidohydrolase YtcJ